MCLVKTPKMPTPVDPAAPPPPPEESAADAQGAPEIKGWSRLNRKDKNQRNSLRIDPLRANPSMRGLF